MMGCNRITNYLGDNPNSSKLNEGEVDLNFLIHMFPLNKDTAPGLSGALSLHMDLRTASHVFHREILMISIKVYHIHSASSGCCFSTCTVTVE